MSGVGYLVLDDRYLLGRAWNMDSTGTRAWTTGRTLVGSMTASTHKNYSGLRVVA